MAKLQLLIISVIFYIQHILVIFGICLLRQLVMLFLNVLLRSEFNPCFCCHLGIAITRFHFTRRTSSFASVSHDLHSHFPGMLHVPQSCFVSSAFKTVCQLKQVQGRKEQCMFYLFYGRYRFFFLWQAWVRLFLSAFQLNFFILREAKKCWACGPNCCCMREKYACFILSHCEKQHLGVDWTALGCTRLSGSRRDCYNWGTLGKLRACLPFEINPAVIAGGVRTYYGTCCDCLHDKCCAARITGRCFFY